MDGTLYYSCYFGKKPVPGVTAAMNPATGEIQWLDDQARGPRRLHGLGRRRPAVPGRLQSGRRRQKRGLVPGRPRRIAGLEIRSGPGGDSRRSRSPTSSCSPTPSIGTLTCWTRHTGQDHHHAGQGLPLFAVHVLRTVPDRPELRPVRSVRVAVAGFVRAAVGRADVRRGDCVRRAAVSDDQRLRAASVDGRGGGVSLRKRNETERSSDRGIVIGVGWTAPLGGGWQLQVVMVARLTPSRRRRLPCCGRRLRLGVKRVYRSGLGSSHGPKVALSN